MAVRGWKAGYGVRAFGILCLALALLAYVLLEEPHDALLAFALGMLGLFALLVLTEKVVPARAAEAILQGNARAALDTAEGLALTGRASVVPAGGNLTRDRLFLSAAESVKPLPVLDDATVVYAAPANIRTGIAIDPSGRVLLDAWEDATGEPFASMPVANVQSALAGLGLSEGLYKRFRMREEGGRFVMEFAPLDVQPPCLVDGATGRLPCEIAACALCSAACTALARSLGRPVTIAEAEAAKGEIRLRVEPEGP